MPDIQKKRAPSTETNQRAWATVYDDLNDIINSVNKKSTFEGRNSVAGLDGDIRLFKDTDAGKYFIEGKFKDGWAKRQMLFTDKDESLQDEVISYSAVAGFIKPDGSVPFTATQAGIAPVNDADLATKGWVNTNDSDTTYSAMGSGNSYAAGLVLAGHGTHGGNFLRKDGSWNIPPNTTSYSLLNSSSSGLQGTLVFSSSGTEGKLRGIKQGTGILVTSTDDLNGGYLTIASDGAAATIAVSEVNPLGGYLSYTTANLRFIDGGGITWAFSNASNITTVTPSFSSTYDNYISWNIKDHDGTTYSITTNDTLWIKEGTGIDVNFTADDVLTITNTAPDVNHNTDVNWNGSTYSGVQSTGRSTLGLGDIATRDAEDFALVSHNHSAGNITSGTLAVARGGTGVTSVAEIKTTLSLGSAAYTDTGAYAAASHSHAYISTSHAANSITASFITVLGNTSGTNTGDQTLPTRTSLGIDSDDAVTFGALTCPTLNTGQGAYELYKMDQDVDSESAVVFTTVNTGQGANELYDMNQNVLTTSDVTFNDFRADSIGVGTAASGTTGEIRATNEVTAYYSDDRLKNRYGNIEKALDKVCSLNGFHYQPNEVAGQLGYDTGQKKVGVSAQEVLKVLPEAVTEAPIDPQYHAVQYDKLVPLLIEAVKELSERKCGCGV